MHQKTERKFGRLKERNRERENERDRERKRGYKMERPISPNSKYS